MHAAANPFHGRKIEASPTEGNIVTLLALDAFNLDLFGNCSLQLLQDERQTAEAETDCTKTCSGGGGQRSYILSDRMHGDDRFCILKRRTFPLRGAMLVRLVKLDRSFNSGCPTCSFISSLNRDKNLTGKIHGITAGSTKLEAVF